MNFVGLGISFSPGASKFRPTKVFSASCRVTGTVFLTGAVTLDSSTHIPLGAQFPCLSETDGMGQVARLQVSEVHAHAASVHADRGALEPSGDTWLDFYCPQLKFRALRQKSVLKFISGLMS